MKGNIKAWTWLYWTAMFGSTCWVLCSSIVEGKDNTTINYQMVNLVTNISNSESYTKFLQSLRDHLASGEKSHGIPVLPDGFTLPDSQLFLLVKLSNSAKASVTLALDVTNTSVAAYSVGNQSYFFNDAANASLSNLFTDTTQNMLSFGSTYDKLQSAAGKSIDKIDLGLVPLEEAISSLNSISTSSIQKKKLASELAVVIQMVSVAARFRHIEQQVRWSIRYNQTFLPDASLRSLEKNWKILSTAIQESNEGVFSNPVQLQRSNKDKFYVHSVTRELVSNLALMLFICTHKSTSSQFSELVPSYRLCAGNSEPTVRIIGRNSLCVDVTNSNYQNHNPIHLWGCKNNADANQLWTLKRDGTIQSNGKCLNVNEYFAGNNVTIHDCENPTNWEVWDNGTIINPQSGLVLTANSGEKRTILTLEKNIFAASQGWLLTNNTKPFVTSIVGFQDLCLEAIGNGAWMMNCTRDKEEQKWAFYADGSIRPNKIHENCLTCENVKGTNITIIPCCGSSGQRWFFTYDDIIWNLQNGMVFDVKYHNARYPLIIWPLNGNPNQKWLSLL